MDVSREYLDFDVAIEKSVTEYAVRVVDSPAGQAAGPFVLPFEAAELGKFLAAVGPQPISQRVPAVTRVSEVREYGQLLNDALFNGPVGAAFTLSLDLAIRANKGLCIRLRLAGVPEFDPIPWEYLYSKSLGRFLTLSNDTPIVRYLDAVTRSPAAVVEPPLRLLLVASSPLDMPALDVQREIKLLMATTADLVSDGLLIIDVLEGGTFRRLQRSLMDGYHILHFSGHGMFSERDREGVLALEQEDGTADLVDGTRLGLLVHDARDLKLAVLNASEGARTSGQSALSGVAQALVRQGLSAAVAMQTQISDRAAVAFSHEFFDFLLRGHPIESAMCEARKAMATSNEASEWGTAVLLRSSSEQPFLFGTTGSVSQSAKERRWESLYQDAASAIARGAPASAIPILEQIQAEEPRYRDVSLLLDRVRSGESPQVGEQESSTPLRPTNADTEVALMLGWVDVFRRSAGREAGEPLDVVMGAFARARATEGGPPRLSDPVAQSLLESLASSERPLDVILDQAIGPIEVPRDPPVPNADDVARHAPVLSMARKIALRTGDGTISQRHLLAAALTTTELPTALVTVLECDRAELCARLLDAVTRLLPTDDVAAWTTVLSPSELASAFSSDFVPVRRRRPGGQHPEELRDHLDVDVYVTMLATMIARTSTAMPVSVGLFGEWGAGKSYFMELLRQKVEFLSSTGGAHSPYCQDIAQITFNAWTYSDTNLWASLAAEFFSQLGAPETDPNDVRREEIKRSLTEKNQVRGELESIRRATAAQTAEVRKRYDKAVATRNSKNRSLNMQVVEAVLADQEIRQNLRDVGRELGIGEDEAARILQFADDVRGITDDLSATRRVLAQRSLRWPFFLLLATVAVTSAALMLPDGWWSWLTASAAVTSVLAFLSSVGVVVSSSRALVAKLRAVARNAEEARARATSEGGDKRVADLMAQLRRAEADETIAKARLLELDATIAQLDRQLIELEPGRRLYQFIAERAASPDYRNQLGVVSLVRRDFEELVDLMQRWRTERSSGRDVTAKPLDRIVLYIDDLDRCEPEQVVQVLQAVHLLLAMDLFAVVVGVDPRWLLRALRTRYAGILGSDSAPSGENELGFAVTTPQNYLEKIFQVPFVLPSMSRHGFEGLIRSLTSRQQSQRAEGAVAAPDIEKHPAVAVDAAASGETGSGSLPTGSTAPIRPESGSEVADVIAAVDSQTRGKDLSPITSAQITKRELDLLAKLAPLVRTPRAATRMFNIFGLLRSARDLSPGSRFLGTREQPGDYQAVIQLLGILTGAPRLFGLLLWGRGADAGPTDRGLCGSTGTTSWRAFVDSLDPEQDPKSGKWSNGVAASLSPVEIASWRLLVTQLHGIRDQIQLDDIERYRAWAPQVAHFSFLLSSFAAHDS